MNRTVFGGLAVSMMSVSFAIAAPAPQYSAQDIVSTFATGSAAGSCESRGMATGDNGICEPAKNDRGFNLPTRGAPAAASTAPRAGGATRAAAAPARPQAQRDLLITFRTGSADLTSQAQSNAKVFAQAMGMPALAASRFEIAGYTDSVGSADRNLTLSQQRADAVKGFLVANGVDGSRIVAKGYGATDFAVPGRPNAAANRRVEARRVD